MTIPKQNDVKVTKPQNKHVYGRTKKCPIYYIKNMNIPYSCFQQCYS